MSARNRCDSSSAAGPLLDTSVLIAADVSPLDDELASSAATAHAHDARLYTRNADDFRGPGELVGVVSL